MQPTNNQQPNMQPSVTVRGKRLTLPWIVGSVVLALVVISCGCCGLVNLAGALNGGNATAQSTDTSLATTAAQGAQAVDATDTPAPPTGKHVLHISGAAQAVTSKSFTVHNTWVITWGCSPSMSNDLMIMVNDPSGTVGSSDIPTIRTTCAANSSGQQEYHASGTFTLTVSGGAAWDIVVLDVLN